jgi:2-polyprenyl-3-methyl-5-hydroxy-6-metoxy-1,4-benzoquinol methylase
LSLLVIGPSSVGKSSYLQSIGATSGEVIFGGEIRSKKYLKDKSYIHYNLLHPFSHNSTTGKIKDLLKNEKFLKRILNSSYVTEAIVLISEIETLRARAKLRDSIEPHFRGHKESNYPNEHIMLQLDNLDLFKIYKEIFQLLKLRSIPYKVVHSKFDNLRNERDFVEVDEVYAHSVLKNKEIKVPSVETVDSISKHPGMHYQEIQLPHGRSTSKGSYQHLSNSRNVSFDAIFKEVDLRGASILDVGCALGQILFQAEELAAGELYGLEPHAERYDAAVSLVKILNSDVKILNQRLENFYDQNSKTQKNIKFDWVLALNVMHHVTDIHQFCEILTKLSNRFIAIEFPSLAEKIWREDKSTVIRFVRKYLSRSKLPLVGVGDKGYDSTFAFNDSAIKTLIESKSNGNFALRHALDSPIEGRRIAIFEMKNLKTGV